MVLGTVKTGRCGWRYDTRGRVLPAVLHNHDDQSGEHKGVVMGRVRPDTYCTRLRDLARISPRERAACSFRIQCSQPKSIMFRSITSHDQHNNVHISPLTLPAAISHIIRRCAICVHNMSTQCSIIPTDEKDASREAGSFIRAIHHRNERTHHLQPTAQRAECISHATEVPSPIRSTTKAASRSRSGGSSRNAQKVIISTRNHSSAARSITTQS